MRSTWISDPYKIAYFFFITFSSLNCYRGIKWLNSLKKEKKKKTLKDYQIHQSPEDRWRMYQLKCQNTDKVDKIMGSDNSHFHFNLTHCNCSYLLSQFCHKTISSSALLYVSISNQLKIKLLSFFLIRGIQLCNTACTLFHVGHHFARLLSKSKEKIYGISCVTVQSQFCFLFLLQFIQYKA